MSENPGVYIAIKSAVRRLLHKRSKVKGICMKGDRKNIISYYSSAFTINPEPRHRSVRSHSILLCMCTHVHAETYYYWDIGSVTWSKWLSVKSIMRSQNTTARIADLRPIFVVDRLHFTQWWNFRLQVSVCVMSIDVGWLVNKFRGDIQQYVQQQGVLNIDKFFKEKLESWRHVKVDIAITGDAGAGKSSFINRIRG